MAPSGPTRREVREGESLLIGALWGALRVFRILAVVYAAWGAWVRRGDMAHPGAALIILALLALWAAYMYAVPRRTLGIHIIELILTSLTLLATRWVDTPLAAQEGVTTIPGVYQAVPISAIALIGGWRAGLVVAVIVTAVMVAQVGQIDSEPLSNAGLLIMLGVCIGYGADIARKEHAALRRALAKQAEVAERDRLARTVHDGVLQALAFIHRRGVDLGGEAARLGVLAAQHEHQLRALASGVPLPELEAAVDGPVDLRTILQVPAAGMATLVCPHEPVEVDLARAREVAAAVESALDNVRLHAGDEAKAWVLVDDLGADVVVTVRDNGVGIAQDVIDEAATRGRLGISSSIQGRIEDLGGRATYVFGPGGGTTVEMWLPKEVSGRV